MELSKSFPRLDLETTLEVLLDSNERRDEIINGFIRNFKKIENDPEIKYGINIVLNNNHFKEKVKRGEIEENMIPFIDYILKNSIDYRVHLKYLKEYYFYKDAKISKKFIEVYRRNSKGFKELENEFGKNAIHVAILGSNISKDIIKKYINKDLDEEEAIGRLKVLTKNTKLSPRPIQKVVLDKIVKEIYNPSYSFKECYLIPRKKLIIRKDGSIEELIKKDINKRITIYTNSIFVKGNERLYFIYDKKKKRILEVVNKELEDDYSLFYTSDKTIYLIKDTKVKIFENARLLEKLSDDEERGYFIYSKSKGIKKRDKLYLFDIEKGKKEKIKLKPFWKRWKVKEIKNVVFENELLIETDIGFFVAKNDNITIAKYKKDILTSKKEDKSEERIEEKYTPDLTNKVKLGGRINQSRRIRPKIKELEDIIFNFRNEVKLAEGERYEYYLVKYEDENLGRRKKIVRRDLVTGKEKEIVNFKKVLNYKIEDNMLIVKYMRSKKGQKTIYINLSGNSRIHFVEESRDIN